MTALITTSLEAETTLLENPNLALFLGLAYFAYWLYQQLEMEHQNSWVSRLLPSGREWESIIKS